LLGNRIGQNVELKNTHYNLVYFKDRSEEDRTQIGYDFLLSFVDYTFNFGDTSRLKTEEFEKIEQVMNTPIFTDNSAEEAAEIDSSYDNLLSSIENIFANPELKKIEEIERIIKKNDGKCFFEAEKERQGNSRFADINAAQSGAKIIYKHRIIFSKNTKKLSDAQKKQLEEIAEMLNANDELLLNIVGYTYESDAFKPAKGFSDTRKFTKKVFRFLDKRISDVRKFALIASGMSKNLTPQENADDAEGSGKISKIEIVIIQE
jgi:outer membrane protein OmpA-like peptidoglycan-associated protein